MRKQMGEMLLHDYGPQSEGSPLASGVVARVYRMDKGELDNEYSLPHAVVPNLTIQVYARTHTV